MDLDAIRDWNTHWGSPHVSDLVRRHAHARAAVPKMLEEILSPPEGQWSLRPGPRQVGKTTSLGHVMQRLVDRGVPARSVIYVPVDDERVQETCGDSLDDIIRSCFTLHPPTRDLPLYLFLDEVHVLGDWDAKLKAGWDHYHDIVRVIATGSSVLKIGRPADFLNRIRITRMYSMKFREVLQAHPDLSRHLDPQSHGRLFELARTVREAMLGSIVGFNAALDEFHTFIGAHKGLSAFLQSVFHEYCVWGGYPPVRPGAGKGGAERLAYMDATWSNIVAKDLVHAGVTKVREFRLLLRHIARNPGTKFVPNQISQDIGVKSDTVSEWKQILEQLMLVQQLQPLKPDLEPHGGKDKAYTLDPAWFAYWNTITDHTKTLGDASGTIGGLVEAVLVDHLRRLQYNLVGITALSTGYVEGPEVDAAIELGPRWLLVEAKYREHPRSHLAKAGGAGDLRVVVSRSHFQTADPGGIHHVPAHEFALVC